LVTVNLHGIDGHNLDAVYKFMFNGSEATLRVSTTTLLQTTASNMAILGSMQADKMVKVLGYEKVKAARA